MKSIFLQHRHAFRGPRSQKGEIVTALSVITVLVMVLGVAVGVQINNQAVTTQTSAQTQQCQYRAQVNVFKDSRGRYISNSEFGPFSATNDRGDMLTLNRGGRSENLYDGLIRLDPTRQTGYAKGDDAQVTLDIIDSEKWKVKEVYCEQGLDSVRGCPSESRIQSINQSIEQGTSNGLTIGDFTVDCNVNVSYGWIIEERSSQEPSTAPTQEPSAAPTQEPSPSPSVPTSSPSPDLGVGSMEVRVDILNHPQEVPGWPEGYDGDDKPGSCTRQGPSENQRPLYLQNFTVVAECVGGGCDVGDTFTAQAEKRQGFVNFKNIPTGNYVLDVEEAQGRGYETWSECAAKEWTVSNGENNTTATVLLANFEDGSYEAKGSESTCTAENGIPNLVEGMPGSGGNMCYFPDGPQEPDPEPTDEPEPTPGPDEPLPDPREPETEEQIRVLVANRHEDVREVTVVLDPCPRDRKCSQKVWFSGIGEGEAVFEPGRDQAFDIMIRSLRVSVGLDEEQLSLKDFSLASPVAAQPNGRAVVWHCSSGVVSNDGDDGDQKCRSHAPGSAVFAVYDKSADIPDSPPPEKIPEAPGQPSDKKYGKCPVFASGKCAPSYLKQTFNDLSDEELDQLSAICWRESSGNNLALNNSCESGGTDYSVGLFQINVMPGRTTGLECVRMEGNVCKLYPNGGTEQCILPLYNGDTNIEWARKKWVEQRDGFRRNGFCPWRARSEIDPCDLEDYGTFERCWLQP